MTLKNKLTFLLLVGSLVSYAQNQLHIKGNFKGIPDDATLTLIDSKDNQKSFSVKDGVFDVTMKLPESPSEVLLEVNQNNNPKRYLIFAGNEEISIEEEFDKSLSFIKTTGSKYDDVRYQYDVFMKDLKDESDKIYEEVMQYSRTGELMKNDSLIRAFFNGDEPLGKSIIVHKKIEAKEFEFLKKYINTDFGRNKLKYITNAYTDEQNKELLALVDPAYLNTKGVQYLKALVDYDELQKGDKYYDFSAKDVKGKEVKFNQYFDGKYVLLDLTTIHCGASNMAAPINTELAEKLKDKVTFVTYYIDNNEEYIKMFYEMKQNKGILIWDESGRIAPTLAKYRLSGTPNYYLFDPKGNLVTRIGGYSPEFESDILKEIN